MPKPKPILATGISVHCHFDKILSAGALKPYPGNWKSHPPAQLDRYEQVIRGNGWRRAVVISKLSGCITKGHGAWQTAKRAGLDIPVEYQPYKNRAEEIRDLVADNKLAELAQDDDTALAKLLSELDTGDLSLAAVSSDELRTLIASLAETEQPLAEVPIPDPPRMAWVLIGVPLVRFAEISAHIEAIAALESTVVESTLNDQLPEPAQP